MLLTVLVLLGWYQAWWQHARLPERVATHFNAVGQPNGWMTRDQHLVWQWVAFTFVGLLMQGLVWLQGRLPAEYVNLPHRDYWLAPERRAATQDWLSSLLLISGSLLVGFFLVLFHLVYRTNLTASPSLTNWVWPLGLLLTAAILGTVFFVVRRFSRRPAS